MNLTRYCQPFHAVSLRHKRTAKLCAAFVFFKGHLRFFCVTVDLPSADTYTAASLVFDKAADILRRIA